MVRIRRTIMVSVMLMTMAALHADAQTRCPDWCLFNLETGNSLGQKLRSGDPILEVAAVGYMRGCIDALCFMNIAEPTCVNLVFHIPNGTSHEQLAKIVENYLGRHPEKSDVTGVALIWSALKEAYPCEQSAPQQQKR